VLYASPILDNSWVFHRENSNHIFWGCPQVLGFMDEPMASHITPFLNFFSIIPLFLQAVSRYMSIVRDTRPRDRHFLTDSFFIMGVPWQG